MIKEPFEPYFDGEVDQQAWQFHQTKHDFFEKKASSLWRETNACWEATQFCKYFYVLHIVLGHLAIKARIEKAKILNTGEDAFATGGRLSVLHVGLKKK